MRKLKQKRIYYIAYAFLCTFSFNMMVFAKTKVYKKCEDIFGNINDKTSTIYFMQQIYNVFKFGVPLLCVVLSIFEFVKAVASQDKDALSKATKRTLIRVILTFVLFIIPVLIDFIFPLLGFEGTCGIS